MALPAYHVATLWSAVDAEEVAMHDGISEFDMFYATIRSVSDLPDDACTRLGLQEHGGDSRAPLFVLSVPGLREGKPPVFRGDPVYLRPEKVAKNVEFCCCAILVLFSELVLQVPVQAGALLRLQTGVHVRFSIDRARLSMMRGAAGRLLRRKDRGPDLLGDSAEPPGPPDPPVDRWFRKLNAEQRLAVEAFLGMPAKSPPLLLLGPPGTGKSWVVAECVTQLLARRTCALRCGALRTLVCAPTEIACDLLVEAVHDRWCASCPEGSSLVGRLLRFFEPKRPLQTLFSRNRVLQYSLLEHATGSFRHPQAEEWEGTSVVVCTLRAAWALGEVLKAAVDAFGFVLVDEAGQALEVEAYAARAIAAPGARVLLAGDTRQLGPESRAVQRGALKGTYADLLGSSLLERLSNHPRWSAEDSQWTFQLYQNYRSYPALLELLSAVSYEGRLIACADESLVRKFERHPVLPREGFPLVVIGVRGQQIVDIPCENQHCLSRPDVSHSYHNPQEALAVLEFVRSIMRPQEGVPPASPNDIGVVCAFRRQVQKIRGLLRSNGLEAIRVGTVTDYQGQQERVLVISTTLTDPSSAALLQQLPVAGAEARSSLQSTQGDIASHLEDCIRIRLQSDEAQNGSWPVEQQQSANLLGNQRLFTVALSRAQCLLAIVGCPEVLETSSCWRRLLTYAAAHGALCGEPFSAAVASPAAVLEPEVPRAAESREAAAAMEASVKAAAQACTSDDRRGADSGLIPREAEPDTGCLESRGQRLECELGRSWSKSLKAESFENNTCSGKVRLLSAKRSQRAVRTDKARVPIKEVQRRLQ